MFDPNPLIFSDGEQVMHAMGLMDVDGNGEVSQYEFADVFADSSFTQVTLIYIHTYIRAYIYKYIYVYIYVCVFGLTRVRRCLRRLLIHTGDYRYGLL